MKKEFLKICAVSAVGVLLIGAAGCVNTVDGRSRAGVPWLKDRIESTYERTVPQVMVAARETLKLHGTLITEDIVGNSLEGRVDARVVYVKVEEVDPKVSRVVVQVRTKAGGRDIELASEIDKQIALHLAR